MSRNNTSQRQRTANNPLLLGKFNQTTIRYLSGSLGPLSQVVGRADTATQSNGGFGGGTYNHWFRIDLLTPAWIITAKGPPRPKYIQISAYDINKNPIQGRGIFDADSVRVNDKNGLYFPYLDTIMSAGSNLYNTYNQYRLDKSDERYFPLEAGSYLICVSSTRNERIDYTMALVVEFPTDEIIIALEDDERAFLLKETAIDFNNTVNIPSLVSVDTTISLVPGVPNGFTENTCTINSGVTVTIIEGSTWLIGEQIPSAQASLYSVLGEPGNDLYFESIHDHSLAEWREVWERDFQRTAPFPELLVAFTNRS